MTVTEIEIDQSPAATRRTLDVVVPVHNESAGLELSIRRLRGYLDTAFPITAVVTIVDNASTDGTWEIATRLAGRMAGVRALRLDAKGRGRALRAAWTASDADIVAYMDVDLSTDLDALLPLVAPLLSGHSDVAIGSRLAPGARVVRGPKRELISRIYNLLLRLALRKRFSDAQCGFKALRAEDARALLPAVVDEEWFFDTELLVVAERNGLRIHEVPVDWSDDPDSRVDVTRTAIADLKGVCRLLRGLSAGGGRVDGLARRGRPEARSEATRFARVGIRSTVVYLALYLLLRAHMGSYAANALLLSACTAGNVAGHLRYTFAGRRSQALWTSVGGAAMTLATSLVLTTGCLALGRLLAGGSLPAEVTALLVGTAFAALAGFVTLRALVYRAHLRSVQPPSVQDFPSSSQ